MTGFVKGERDGNVIRPAGSNNSGSTVDEFASHEDIEEAELDSDDLIIEELSGDSRTRIRERDSDEHYIKLNPQSEYVQKYFDDDEIEELSEKDRIVNGSPDEPEDIDEVWDGMRKDVEAHNREVAKRKKEKEIEKAKEFTKPERHRKELSELTGDEFAQLVKDGQSDSQQHNEELEKAIEAIEQKYDPIINGGSEPDIKDPNDAVEDLSEATDAFREYAEKEGSVVFDELAEDIEDSDGLTEYITLSDNSRRVRTKEPELRDAIVNHENEPFEGSVEIHDSGDEWVEATISKGE